MVTPAPTLTRRHYDHYCDDHVRETRPATGAPEDSAERHFDVIVIGSGMGGLATASLLSNLGKKRVLVLESGFKLGGFLHSFQRKGHTWDPGVHYIGAMKDGSLTRNCMDLVTGHKIEWHKLDEHFERYVFPNETFKVSSDPKQFKQDLIARFPDEAKAIKKYFRDLKRALFWSQRWYYSKTLPEPLASMMTAGRKLVETTTQDYLDENFSDPLLKAILPAQWPDFGSPPGTSAFGIHATVAGDFLDGGYCPLGGASQIIDNAVAIIEAGGGECRTKHPVTEVLIKNNEAYGVKVESRSGPEQFYAPQIVSNAGVATTFNKLVGTDVAEVERRRLATHEPGTSAAVLYLGLNDDPRKHGFENCNYWIFNQLDHNLDTTPTEFPPKIFGCYLSFGSLRNTKKPTHTAQIATFSDKVVWEAFADRPWKKRGVEYEAMKTEFSEHLLDFVEERFPGIRDLISHMELSTPLTVESFMGHPNGEIYGRKSTRDRVARDGWSIGTSVKGLYLTGTDLVCSGINSALMIGVMTAGKLMGAHGVPMIVHEANKQDAKR